ncbi:hypothetical protein [Corallococcus sicarius]|uniref:hypothetical protein n=1 Tax=Corallococcus sicarius TaxID=2316726 RepID=UPI001FCA41E5|nr:hypothetical protein [Corallococcus sicarius]
MRVKGFGKKKFLKLSAHLALSGPTTLKMEKVPAPPVAGKRGTGHEPMTSIG